MWLFNLRESRVVRGRVASPALQWRHNARDDVSNHRLQDCFNRLFRRRSKKTSNPRVTGLCEGNSPMIDEFPTQQRTSMASMFPFDDIIMWCHCSDYFPGSLGLIWIIAATHLKIGHPASSWGTDFLTSCRGLKMKKEHRQWPPGNDPSNDHQTTCYFLVDCIQVYSFLKYPDLFLNDTGWGCR